MKGGDQMATKFFVRVFLALILLCASVSAQQMSANPADNVVALALSSAPDRTGIIVSAVQTAECVPYYQATLELSEYVDGKWFVVDTLRANLGSMRSIEVNGQVLPGRRDFKFGNVRLGPTGRVFRVMPYAASIYSENGCVVGTPSRPYTHIELAYMVWRQPVDWPDDLYLGPATQIGVPGSRTLDFVMSRVQNPTRVILFQDAGWDFVRARTRVVNEPSDFRFLLDDFRREVPEVHLYFLDMVTGKSISIAGFFGQDFFGGTK